MLWLIRPRETYGHLVQLLFCERSLLSGLGRFFLNWRRSDFQTKLWRLKRDAQSAHIPWGLLNKPIYLDRK